MLLTLISFFSQNDEQMSLSSLVDSKFYRTLLEEEGGNVKELLDAEEYLVPQPGFFENQANGLARHHSHRVRSQISALLH